MKYRVQQYVIVRVPVDIEADSIGEAILKADRQFEPQDVNLFGEYSEHTSGYQIDQPNPDGTINYEKSVTAEWQGDELVDFRGDPI